MQKSENESNVLFTKVDGVYSKGKLGEHMERRRPYLSYLPKIENREAYIEAYLCYHEADVGFLDFAYSCLHAHWPSSFMFYRDYGYDKDKPEEERKEIEEDLLDLIPRLRFLIVLLSDSFLNEANFARDEEFRKAIETHVPILPIIAGKEGSNENLKARFNIYCKETLGCESGYHVLDPQEVGYQKDLKDFFDAINIDESFLLELHQTYSGSGFLSYRRMDKAHAKELINLIHAQKELLSFHVWFDDFLAPGDAFDQVIGKQIQQSEVFLLLVTPNLLQEGNYVMEVEYKAAKEGSIVPYECEGTDPLALSGCYESLPPIVTIGLNQAEELSSRIGSRIHPRELTGKEKGRLGLAYLKGIEFERNQRIGFSLLQEAFESGERDVAKELSLCYLRGDGVQKSVGRAYEWAKRYLDATEKAGITGKPLHDVSLFFVRRAIEYGEKTEARDALLNAIKILEGLGEENYLEDLIEEYSLLLSVAEEEYYVRRLELLLDKAKGHSFDRVSPFDICKAYIAIMDFYARRFYHDEAKTSGQKAIEAILDEGGKPIGVYEYIYAVHRYAGQAGTKKERIEALEKAFPYIPSDHVFDLGWHFLYKARALSGEKELQETYGKVTECYESALDHFKAHYLRFPSEASRPLASAYLGLVRCYPNDKREEKNAFAIGKEAIAFLSPLLDSDPDYARFLCDICARLFPSYDKENKEFAFIFLKGVAIILKAPYEKDDFWRFRRAIDIGNWARDNDDEELAKEAEALEEDCQKAIYQRGEEEDEEKRKARLLENYEAALRFDDPLAISDALFELFTFFNVKGILEEGRRYFYLYLEANKAIFDKEEGRLRSTKAIESFVMKRIFPSNPILFEKTMEEALPILKSLGNDLGTDYSLLHEFYGQADYTFGNEGLYSLSLSYREKSEFYQYHYDLKGYEPIIISEEEARSRVEESYEYFSRNCLDGQFDKALVSAKIILGNVDEFDGQQDIFRTLFELFLRMGEIERAIICYVLWVFPLEKTKKERQALIDRVLSPCKNPLPPLPASYQEAFGDILSSPYPDLGKLKKAIASLPLHGDVLGKGSQEGLWAAANLAFAFGGIRFFYVNGEFSKAIFHFLESASEFALARIRGCERLKKGDVACYTSIFASYLYVCNHAYELLIDLELMDRGGTYDRYKIISEHYPKLLSLMKGYPREEIIEAYFLSNETIFKPFVFKLLARRYIKSKTGVKLRLGKSEYVLIDGLFFLIHSPDKKKER